MNLPDHILQHVLAAGEDPVAIARQKAQVVVSGGTDAFIIGATKGHAADLVFFNLGTKWLMVRSPAWAITDPDGTLRVVVCTDANDADHVKSAFG